MAGESQSCLACDQDFATESIFCSQCGTNILLIEKIKLTDALVKISINENLVANYKKLHQILLDMSDVEELAEMQNNYYKALNKQKLKLRDPIQQARLKLVAQKKDVKDLKNLNWISLKARVKGDLDDKLFRKEQEYLIASDHNKALLNQRSDLEIQIVNAKNQLVEAQGLINKKLGIQNEIKELIKKIGAVLTHPVEDKMEDKLKVISVKLHEVERLVFELKLHRSYANNAVTLFYSGLAALDNALGGGNAFSDTPRSTKILEARNLTHTGNEQLAIAIEGLEEIDPSEFANVKNLGGWSDFFFEGSWVDLSVNLFATKRISDSRESVMKAINKAQAISQKYYDLILGLSDELEGTRNEYITLEEKLLVKRIELIEKYIEKEKGLESSK